MQPMHWRLLDGASVIFLPDAEAGKPKLSVPALVARSTEPPPVGTVKTTVVDASLEESLPASPPAESRSTTLPLSTLAST